MIAKMSPVMVLSKFFGKKEGETLQEFAEEVRKLTEDEKRELVTLAAKSLEVEVEWKT